jgi:soluble lytic murein transglycosylase-like protein/outer membrane protein assembly factor BamD (BamD/ComL family)
LAVALVAAGVLGTLPALGTDTEGEALAETVTPVVSSAPEYRSIVEIGQVFPSAPKLTREHAEPTLRSVQLHMRAGDTRAALHAAERFVAHRKWGRERDAAWLTIGLLHREEGRHNLASEAFTKVRAAKGPLAAWGAFYEAEQDLHRGKEWVAIRECERLQKDHPASPFSESCARIIARGHAALGRVTSARNAAQAYDEDHPDAPISEQVEIRLAEWEVEHHPDRAVRRLKVLAIDHEAPLTGRFAEELLVSLRDAGVEGTELPNDTPHLMTRASSLRDARRYDDAWSAYEELMGRAEDDPELQRWVEDTAEAFGWRTHRWDFLADLYGRAYAEKPDSEYLWSQYKVLDRGGRHSEATAIALEGQKKHANTREWRRKEESVGRTFLLARDYVGARSQFDKVAARGGWTGRRAAFYAAFSSYMNDEHDDAIARFSKIVDHNSSYAMESRYWRSRSLEAMENIEAARADQDWILENEPQSWYAVVLDQRNPNLPVNKPFLRDGTWAGAPLPARPAPVAHIAATYGVPPVASPASSAMYQGSMAFGLLSWAQGGFGPRPAIDTTESLVVKVDELLPPQGYAESYWFDEDKSRRMLYQFAETHKDGFPDWQAVYDAARAGLYDLSGPLMSKTYEDWRKAWRSGSNKRHTAARKVRMRAEDWRALFLYSRDHHHSARFTYGLWDDLEDPELIVSSRRLAHPIAHDRLIWTHARAQGIDPYLVLGLMRQESTYNAIAVSRVGASGAMQIMPRTGLLLADIDHNTAFTPGDLEDPTLSIEYGIFYLGLLMDRFDGAYPLAVASYNGGPFNVSQWLKGTGAEMPMDEWVEHIPFRETRDYVKKGRAGYSTYLDLYAPEGTHIVLPPTPRGDHPEIVDF